MKSIEFYRIQTHINGTRMVKAEGFADVEEIAEFSCWIPFDQFVSWQPRMRFRNVTRKYEQETHYGMGVETSDSDDPYRDFIVGLGNMLAAYMPNRTYLRMSEITGDTPDGSYYTFSIGGIEYA